MSTGRPADRRALFGRTIAALGALVAVGGGLFLTGGGPDRGVAGGHGDDLDDQGVGVGLFQVSYMDIVVRSSPLAIAAWLAAWGC